MGANDIPILGLSCLNIRTRGFWGGDGDGYGDGDGAESWALSGAAGSVPKTSWGQAMTRPWELTAPMDRACFLVYILPLTLPIAHAFE